MDWKLQVQILLEILEIRTDKKVYRRLEKYYQNILRLVKIQLKIQRNCHFISRNFQSMISISILKTIILILFITNFL